MNCVFSVPFVSKCKPFNCSLKLVFSATLPFVVPLTLVSTFEVTVLLATVFLMPPFGDAGTLVAVVVVVFFNGDTLLIAAVGPVAAVRALNVDEVTRLVVVVVDVVVAVPVFAAVNVRALAIGFVAGL